MQYRIRIAGHLDHSWREWFHHLEVVHEAAGTTLLHGDLNDQAALYGVLFRIHHRGITLLSLEQEQPEEREEPIWQQ